MVQLSLGLVLHGLSACGHAQASSLAENVGAKWLQEVQCLADPDQVRSLGAWRGRVYGEACLHLQVVAMMAGLAGLVGVEPARGVAWEAACCLSQHSDMILTMAYLLVDKVGGRGIVGVAL